MAVRALCQTNVHLNCSVGCLFPICMVSVPVARYLCVLHNQSSMFGAVPVQVQVQVQESLGSLR